MGPEPGKINTGDKQEIKLKCRAEENRACVLKYKMKNETGNKQNCDQYERLINHAQQPPPEYGCERFHHISKSCPVKNLGVFPVEIIPKEGGETMLSAYVPGHATTRPRTRAFAHIRATSA